MPSGAQALLTKAQGARDQRRARCAVIDSQEGAMRGFGRKIHEDSQAREIEALRKAKRQGLAHTPLHRRDQLD